MKTANEILRQSGISMKDILSKGGIGKIEKLVIDGIKEGITASAKACFNPADKNTITELLKNVK